MSETIGVPTQTTTRNGWTYTTIQTGGDCLGDGNPAEDGLAEVSEIAPEAAPGGDEDRPIEQCYGLGLAGFGPLAWYITVAGQEFPIRDETGAGSWQVFPPADPNDPAVDFGATAKIMGLVTQSHIEMERLDSSKSTGHGTAFAFATHANDAELTVDCELFARAGPGGVIEVPMPTRARFWYEDSLYDMVDDTVCELTSGGDCAGSGGGGRTLDLVGIKLDGYLEARDG